MKPRIRVSTKGLTDHFPYSISHRHYKCYGDRKFHQVQVSSRSSKPAARGDERTKMTIIEVTQHHGGWEVSETIGTVHAYFPTKKEAVIYAKERLAFGPAELRFERNGAKRAKTSTFDYPTGDIADPDG